MIGHLRGLGDLTSGIAQAIAQMEGYNTPGTLAQRNNNPGNLRSGQGQTGTSGGFAVFPDAATGWAALDNQIDLNIARGLTLEQFFAGGNGYAGYAPSADSNNPAAYAAFVASQTGIDPNVPLNQLDSSSGDGASCDPSIDPTCDTSVTGDNSVFGIDSNLFTVLALAGSAALVWVIGGRG